MAAFHQILHPGDPRSLTGKVLDNEIPGHRHGAGSIGIAGPHRDNLHPDIGIQQVVHRGDIILEIVLAGKRIVAAQPHQPDIWENLRRLERHQGDIGQFADGYHHERIRGGIPAGLLYNEVHGFVAVEGGICDRRTDGFEIRFRTGFQDDPLAVFTHERDYPPGFERLAGNSVTVVRIVGGHADGPERFRIHQQIGQRVLVVQLVVGVRVQNHIIQRRRFGR